jgi:hypothetical protein
LKDFNRRWREYAIERYSLRRKGFFVLKASMPVQEFQI